MPAYPHSASPPTRTPPGRRNGSAPSWTALRAACLALALLAASAALLVAPAAATPSASLAAEVNEAFARYGWTQPARAYLRERVPVLVDPPSLPNERSLAGMYTSGRIVIWEPARLGDWLYETIAHEYGHAIEDARGWSPATAGPLLHDLLQLAQDPRYPGPAWAARHLLQLQDGPTGDWMLDGYYAGMLDRRDFGHLLLALLERGAGFDVGKLPEWFRQAYFPHLQPGPPNPYPVRVLARPETAPADLEQRILRVKELIAALCGPGADGRPVPPASACRGRSRWVGVPFDPLPGAEGRGPAAPVADTRAAAVGAVADEPAAVASADLPPERGQAVEQAPPGGEEPAAEEAEVRATASLRPAVE